jgi:hypothetical protein
VFDDFDQSEYAPAVYLHHRMLALATLRGSFFD